MQNLLYDTSTGISSSTQTNRNAGNKNNGYDLVTHQDMLPPMPSLPLSFDILFFSFLLPATTVILISGQQRTAHDDANSTYLTVLLF